MKKSIILIILSIILVGSKARAQEFPPLLTPIFDDIRNELAIEVPHVQYSDTFSCELTHEGYAPHCIFSIDIQGMEDYLDFNENHQIIVREFTDQVLELSSNEWAIDLYQLCYMKTDSTSHAVMFMDYVNPITTTEMLLNSSNMADWNAIEGIRNQWIEKVDDEQR